ncbi:MAG: putative glutaredoxin.1 [Anaerolineales bacterium]|nr:putative glutaredoxin.1 [Anaerolineales bacterium]
MSDKIIVYSTVWCPDCKRAKRFFDEHGIAYENVNIEEDSDAMEFVKRINHGYHSVPTIVFPDGSILVEPRNRDLAEKFGMY